MTVRTKVLLAILTFYAIAFVPSAVFGTPSPWFSLSIFVTTLALVIVGVVLLKKHRRLFAETVRWNEEQAMLFGFGSINSSAEPTGAAREAWLLTVENPDGTWGLVNSFRGPRQDPYLGLYLLPGPLDDEMLEQLPQMAADIREGLLQPVENKDTVPPFQFRRFVADDMPPPKPTHGLYL